MSRRWWRWAVAWLCLVEVLFAEELPGEKDRWTLHQSPHFEIYAVGLPGRAREWLYRLELLRKVIEEHFPEARFEEVPLTLFSFRRQRDLRAYQPEPSREVDLQVLAFPGDDRGRVLIAAVDEESTERVIYFSFMSHFLQTSALPMPAWVRQGLSEVYADFEQTGRHLSLGRPSARNVHLLGEYDTRPVQTLFAARIPGPKTTTSEEALRWGNECWLLVHFLLFSEDHLPKGGGRRFLQWSITHPYANQAEILAATQECLGLDFDGLEAKLSAYQRGGRFAWRQIPVPELPDPESYASRAVSAEEIRWRLREVAAVVAGDALAAVRLRNEASGVADPRVLETVGALASRPEDVADRVDAWRRAAELGSVNPVVSRELLREAVASRWPSYSPEFVLPSEEAAAWRRQAEAIRERDRDEEVAYEALAWLNAYASAPRVEELAMVQAKYSLFRAPDRVVLALATAAFKLRQPKDVEAFLDFLAKLEADVSVQQRAEILRATLEKRPPDFSRVRLSSREVEQQRRRLQPP